MDSRKCSLMLAVAACLVFLAIQTLGAPAEQEACNGHTFRCENVTHYQRCRTQRTVGRQRVTVLKNRLFRCPTGRSCNDAGTHPCIADATTATTATTATSTVPGSNDEAFGLVATLNSTKPIANDIEKPSTQVSAAPVVSADETIAANVTQPAVAQNEFIDDGDDDDDVPVHVHGGVANSAAGSCDADDDDCDCGNNCGDDNGCDDCDDGIEDLECKFIKREEHPKTCDQYLLCIAGRTSVRECPKNHAFSGGIRACTRNWGRCSHIGKCKEDGDLLPVPHDNSSYLLCVKKKISLFGAADDDEDECCDGQKAGNKTTTTTGNKFGHHDDDDDDDDDCDGNGNGGDHGCDDDDDDDENINRGYRVLKRECDDYEKFDAQLKDCVCDASCKKEKAKKEKKTKKSTKKN